jgi:hypothetical protein
VCKLLKNQCPISSNSNHYPLIISQVYPRPRQDNVVQRIIPEHMGIKPLSRGFSRDNAIIQQDKTPLALVGYSLAALISATAQHAS